jgi:hypothetical protein
MPAHGLNPTLADTLVNAIFKGGTYTGPAGVYIQLHVGYPGPNGINNTSFETDRKQITWLDIEGTQDSTMYSLWDAPTGGNYIMSGDLNSPPYVAGDTFNIQPNGLVVQILAVYGTSGGGTTGINSVEINKIANTMLKAGPPYTGPDTTQTWIAIHDNAPGPTGTNGVYGGVTPEARKQVFFGSVVNARVTSTNVLTWPEILQSGNINYVSLWTAATAGTYLAAGSITTASGSIITGDTGTFPAGSISFGLSVAS